MTRLSGGKTAAERGARRCSVSGADIMSRLDVPITLGEGCFRLVEDISHATRGWSATGADFGIHDRRDPQCC
jgi:hypothetical protein